LRGLLGLVALCAAAYFLWRADVLPGLWDVQHWGQDVDREAEVARDAHREARLLAFDEEVLPESAVVFLGSSTIERMPLDELFPGASVLNRGIGDEPAAELLQRIDRGIEWSRVSGVALYAGSVDLRRLDAEPNVVARRVATVVQAILERAPERPILLVGLLSQRDLTLLGRRSLADANTELESLAEQFEIGFLPTDRPPLTGEGGRLDEGHSADRLHLNRLGYQVLGRWIRQNGGPLASLLSL
jgi:lysophospholipase L1-like esterase